ncbi:MAG TPA: hypothetical protein VGG42_06245 [Acidobacteriaceae bacterium]
MHPSWAAAMDSLQDYLCWVDEVVLPIAFQWIEEHKPEVYANVPEELKDDVGVAIAAAFGLVNELPVYKQGREKCRGHEEAMKAGNLDTSSMNPVWAGITQKIRRGTREAFAEQSQVLDGTIP